jgi:hypothetical protein
LNAIKNTTADLVFLGGILMFVIALGLSLFSTLDSLGIPQYPFMSPSFEPILGFLALASAVSFFFGWRSGTLIQWTTFRGSLTGMAIFLASVVILIVTLFYPSVIVNSQQGPVYVMEYQGQPYLGIEFGIIVLVLSLLASRQDKKETRSRNNRERNYTFFSLKFLSFSRVRIESILQLFFWGCGRIRKKKFTSPHIHPVACGAGLRVIKIFGVMVVEMIPIYLSVVRSFLRLVEYFPKEEHQYSRSVK